MKEVLTMENIALGGVIEAANDELAKCCQDVVNRMHNSAKRTVTIKISISPKIEQLPGGEELNMPEIDWGVGTSMPGFNGMKTKAFVEGGKVLINTKDPRGVDCPGQTYIND